MRYFRHMLLALIIISALLQAAPVFAQDDPDYVIDVPMSAVTPAGEVTTAGVVDETFAKVLIWENRYRVAIEVVNPLHAQVDWAFDGRKDRSGQTLISQQVMDISDAWRYGESFYLKLWVNAVPMYTSEFIVPDVAYGPIWSWLRLSPNPEECLRGQGQTDPLGRYTISDPQSGSVIAVHEFELGDAEWITPWMPLSSAGPATVDVTAEFFTDGVLRTTNRFQGVPNLCYRPVPQIQLTKETDTPSVNAGQPIRFSLVVTSTGNSTAHAVQVQDPLPQAEGFNWVIQSSPDGAVCTIANNVLSCTLGDMLPGEIRKIDLGSPTTEATVPVCGSPMTVSNVGYASSTDGGNDQDDSSLQIFCNPKPQWEAIRGTLVIYKNTGNTILTAGSVSIPGTNCIAQFAELLPGQIGYFFCGETPLIGNAKYGKADVAPTLGVLPQDWKVLEVPTTVYVPQDPQFTLVVKETVLNQCVYLSAIQR